MRLAMAQVTRSLELDPSMGSNAAAHTIQGHILADRGQCAQALRLGERLSALREEVRRLVSDDEPQE